MGKVDLTDYTLPIGIDIDIGVNHVFPLSVTSTTLKTWYSLELKDRYFKSNLTLKFSSITSCFGFV